MMYYKPLEKIDTEYFRNKEKYISRRVKPTSQIISHHSISVVTRCMNRLHDLRKTLLKNLQDNQNYQEAEFVILDYNSTDGLFDWLKKDMIEFLQSGRLKYYRTNEPKNFCPNHSQNVAFRLAQNELVANVDCDNFMHFGYLERINQCCFGNGAFIAVPSNFLEFGSKHFYLKGRFAARKSDIELLSGFDEDLDGGFGNDDVNFSLRAILAGFSIVCYESHFTEGRIETSNEDRIAFVKNNDFNSMIKTNCELTWSKLSKGIISVNEGRHWGKANLIDFFGRQIQT